MSYEEKSLSTIAAGRTPARSAMLATALTALGLCAALHADGIKIYTTEDDFNEGALINLQILPDATNHHLKLIDKGGAFDFIWIAASNRGTVVKIDTKTGDILGEYRTTPSSSGAGNPSRTTVDNDGSVWVANRNDVNVNGVIVGTVVHIGLVENNQCEDRNGNGVIDTSTGLGDVRPWADASGVRRVATAEDECITHYVVVNARGTRHVSVDANNDVWVSGFSVRTFDLIKGGKWDIPGSGTIIRSEPSVGFGGYGGLIDASGVIWSARGLLRWPTVNPLTGPNGDPPGNSIGPLLPGTNWAGQNSPDSYGLCIDPAGNVWNTQLSGNLIHKYAPDGTHLGAFAHGHNNAQGCVADSNGDIWVAHSLFSTTTVGHLLNDGTHVGNVPLPGGNGPTGVAVDGNGKIWVANINSNNAMRIDPTAGPLGGGGVPIGEVDMTVDLGPGAGAYNYSDMTGSTLTGAPDNGSWTVVYDSGVTGAVWGTITWNDEPEGDTPGDSQLTVEARSSTDGVNWSPFESVTYGVDLTVPDGRYLQVRVAFARAGTGASPILSDLTIRRDTTCVGDLNGDGVVDYLDLLLLAAYWGKCPDDGTPCLGDLNGDGRVDIHDILILLNDWGCVEKADDPCVNGTGDCFESNGTPGCDDPACCGLVCAADPYCCDVEWDQLCADQAVDLCQFDPAPECEGASCGNFIPCAADPDCICVTLFTGGGICVDGTTQCAPLTQCPNGNECAPGEICAVETCCVVNVCVPPSTFCDTGALHAPSTDRRAAPGLPTIGSFGAKADSIR
jgi:streptogramin lyase